MYRMAKYSIFTNMQTGNIANWRFLPLIDLRIRFQKLFCRKREANASLANASLHRCPLADSTELAVLSAWWAFLWYCSLKRYIGASSDPKEATLPITLQPISVGGTLITLLNWEGIWGKSSLKSYGSKLVIFFNGSFILVENKTVWNVFGGHQPEDISQNIRLVFQTE